MNGWSKTALHRYMKGKVYYQWSLISFISWGRCAHTGAQQNAPLNFMFSLVVCVAKDLSLWFLVQKHFKIKLIWMIWEKNCAVSFKFGKLSAPLLSTGHVKDSCMLESIYTQKVWSSREKKMLSKRNSHWWGQSDNRGSTYILGNFKSNSCMYSPLVVTPETLPT